MKTLEYIVLSILVVSLTACQFADNGVQPVVVDPAELETFADAFFPAQMEELHIPGVIFVFAQDKKVILAKGYGEANLENGIPMLPDDTVMRIGSVSKTFVATAVMQLVEQGKLDLHTDVNQYLTAFQLEDTFRKPVTLAHLLTHTAGFEDPPYVSNTDPNLVQPLGAYLAKAMPPRIDRPGKVFRYSNHGYALVACTTAGNNAFFVRTERLGDVPPRTAAEAYRPRRFAEHKALDGRLTGIVDPRRQLHDVRDLPLVDVTDGRTTTVGDITSA